MRAFCLAMLAVLLVGSAFVRADDSATVEWVAERIKLPDGLSDISLSSEYVFEHDGGLLLLAEAPGNSRLLFLKHGNIEPVTFPDGKQSHPRPIEVWNTPNGFFVTAYTEGIDTLVCRLDGKKLVPLKDSKGADFVAQGVKFSNTEGLPLLSVHRVLGLFKTVDVLHVMKGDKVETLKTPEGEPLEAHKWSGMSGHRKLFATVSTADGTFENDAVYYRLEDGACTVVEMRPPVAPEGAQDTSTYLDRYFIGGEIVVFGWNEEATGYRLWMERDGKAEWFQNAGKPINHVLSLVYWAADATFVAGAGKGADGKSTSIAYRVVDDRTEALVWPEEASLANTRFEYARGQLFLTQRKDGAARFWLLVDNVFEPVVGVDGKPLSIKAAANLVSYGRQLGIATGLLTNQSVYVLSGATARPVRNADGAPATFPEGFTLMGVQGQPFVQWWESAGGGYLSRLRLLDKEGKLVVVKQSDGKVLPDGDSVMLEGEDGIYLELVQNGTVGFWWIHKAG